MRLTTVFAQKGNLKNDVPASLKLDGGGTTLHLMLYHMFERQARSTMPATPATLISVSSPS